MNKEELLKTIDEEINKFQNYYTMVEEFTKGTLKTILKLNGEENITLEMIAKAEEGLNEEDKYRYEVLSHDLDLSKNEKDVAIRTLTWVKELLKDKDSES